MFRLLWNQEGKTILEENSVPEIDHDQQLNCFKDIVILSGHTAPVSCALNIDSTRFLSIGHDKKAVMWDTKNGNSLFTLSGMAHSVVSAISFGNNLHKSLKGNVSETVLNMLVTASLDDTIRIWDCLNGECKKIVKEHGSTVKCFYILNRPSILVVTGGQNLCLWDTSFRLLYSFERNSFDYIHSILQVKEDRIVTASDNPHLIVFDIKETDNNYILEEKQKLYPHREPVSLIVPIIDAMFASASVDGGIVIWTSHRFEPLKKFNHHPDYIDHENHTFPYDVQQLLVLEQKYLIATIGCGFAIFDLTLNAQSNEKTIVEQPLAHHAQVTSVAVLNDGQILATSSCDGTVRLWGDSTKRFSGENVPAIEKLIGKKIFQCPNLPVKLSLLGECRIHLSSVQGIVDCGKEGFVSYGADDFLVLWKNSDVLNQRRDLMLQEILKSMDH